MEAFIPQLVYIEPLALKCPLDSKPYNRTFVILDEIFAYTQKYTDERAPEIKRIEAALKVAVVGYTIGYIVAPIYMHDDW
jgi:hypothetical protein